MTIRTPDNEGQQRTPEDRDGQSARRTEKVWVRRHKREDHFKGKLNVNGHWRRGRPKKKENPFERLMRLLMEVKKLQEDEARLFQEAQEALPEFIAWEPGRRSKRRPQRTDGASRASRSLIFSPEDAQVIVALLKRTTPCLDDSTLARAGLRRTVTVQSTS
jgi:hypothetical protein